MPSTKDLTEEDWRLVVVSFKKLKLGEKRSGKESLESDHDSPDTGIATSDLSEDFPRHREGSRDPVIYGGSAGLVIRTRPTASNNTHLGVDLATRDKSTEIAELIPSRIRCVKLLVDTLRSGDGCDSSLEDCYEALSNDIANIRKILPDLESRELSIESLYSAFQQIQPKLEVAHTLFEELLTRARLTDREAMTLFQAVLSHHDDLFFQHYDGSNFTLLQHVYGIECVCDDIRNAPPSTRSRESGDHSGLNLTKAEPEEMQVAEDEWLEHPVGRDDKIFDFFDLPEA